MSAHRLAAGFVGEEGSTSDGETASDLVPEAMSHKRRRPMPFLQDTVIFLLPSHFMSARRREILLPEIRRKGGEVTEDPSAATHCVMSPFPVVEERKKQLCTKYGVPDSCRCVPDTFLFTAPDVLPVREAILCEIAKTVSRGYELHGDRGESCCDE